ncbi:hypothetical protein BaRGS_00003433 [Batillaria attramentaria]|uniref:Uncharacterized protein n=1 Tax=Batillaria attramentaria TaxID=370345 RepID=A0ABD0M0Q2_9CAEN
MGLPMLLSILVAGLVCTIYTAIGGLKAVIWTDTFQMVIVLGGLLAIIIKGTLEAGGVNAVLEPGGRQPRFDPSPFTPYTFWTLVVGGFFTSMTIYGSNQAMIQRYLAMPSTRRAQIALYLNLPAAVVFTTLLVFLGLLAFARYHDNDPVASCRIQKSDQLIPLLVMDMLGGYHGLPGLFVACIFSASLSTVSSGVNALAAVFSSDGHCRAFLQTDHHTKTQRGSSHRHLQMSRSGMPCVRSKGTRRSILVGPVTGKGHSKSDSRPGRPATSGPGTYHAAIQPTVVALVFGLATIGLAFVAGELGPLILQISLSILGIFGGPLLGLFVLALFVPCANSWGAITGLLSSVAVSFWLAIGSTIQRNNNAPPPIVCPTNQTSEAISSTMTSLLSSTTMSATFTSESTDLPADDSDALAVLIALVVGVIVSGTRSKPVDARYLSPWCVWLAGFCNVVYDTASEHSNSETQDTGERKRNGDAVMAELQVPENEAGFANGIRGSAGDQLGHADC